MKVLILTWEFPPFISGGLGMACYGLIKALLFQGVQVDMLLPTSDDVYFPLRGVEDADKMPMQFFATARNVETEAKVKITEHKHLTLRERLEAVGMSISPSAYSTPGYDFRTDVEWTWKLYTERHMGEVERWVSALSGGEDMFKKVQGFTVRALKYAPSLDFDVIHAHDWLTYASGVMLKRMLGKPLVAHIHATEFDRAGGPGDGRIHNIEYEGLTAADRVIAVSQYTAQIIIDRYHVDPKKIRVVHNAYSVDSKAGRARRKLFKDPLVLFLGRVTLQKGPDYFLEVAKRVLERFPKVRFVMAGSGDMFSKILRSAAMKRLRDRFLFTGFLNREQVEDILLATDIFVLPSVSEPFGIAPLEAMAFGAAAIISKQSGVAEVIEHAYKVDFWDVDKTADIIVHLLEDPAEREELARAGKEEVMAIGWKRAAEETLGVYREVACFT